jgi:psp operon transcriptional activator
MNDAPDLLGASESLLSVKDRLSLAAKVERPVLILGERGTGKELAAARLHYLSRRWQGPYVTLNCAALSPGLLDAELFGHEAGAFTGATKRRPGRFEAADGGTLFLDEISHLPLAAQAKILRVVEYGSFQLVGGISERRVDVRVTAATNADLKKMCRRGLFLPDLWDRLSFEVITLPPLRERFGDITLLAHYFGARMAQELGWEQSPVFSPEAIEALEDHRWPGNVRELKNVVERAIYHSDNKNPGSLIGLEALRLDSEVYWPTDTLLEANEPNAQSNAYPIKPGSPEIDERSKPEFPLAPGGFDELIRLEGLRIFENALTESQHSQVRAAELLGLSYHRFRSLKKKLENKST